MAAGRRGSGEVARIFLPSEHVWRGVSGDGDLFFDDGKLPRDGVAGIYQQIERNLQDASRGLPMDYVTTAAFPVARTRPNHLMAMGLLPWVELYRGQQVMRLFRSFWMSCIEDQRVNERGLATEVRLQRRWRRV